MIEKEFFLQLSIREQIESMYKSLLEEPNIDEYRLENIDKNQYPIKFIYDLIYTDDQYSLSSFLAYLDTIRKDLYHKQNIKTHLEFLDAIFPPCCHSKYGNKYCDGRIGDEGGLVCKRYTFPDNSYGYTGKDNGACVDNYIIKGNEYLIKNLVSLYDILKISNVWHKLSADVFNAFNKPIDLITFISYLASSFNLVKEIDEYYPKCEKCHEDLRLISETFKYDSDIKYSCINEKCTECFKTIKFNRCFARGCGAFIDSRKTQIHPATEDNMCLECGSSSCYKAGEYCPSCGSHDMTRIGRQYICNSCKHRIFVSRNNENKPIYDAKHVYLANAVVTIDPE